MVDCPTSKVSRIATERSDLMFEGSRLGTQREARLGSPAVGTGNRPRVISPQTRTVDPCVTGWGGEVLRCPCGGNCRGVRDELGVVVCGLEEGDVSDEGARPGKGSEECSDQDEGRRPTFGSPGRGATRREERVDFRRRSTGTIPSL